MAEGDRGHGCAGGPLTPGLPSETGRSDRAVLNGTPRRWSRVRPVLGDPLGETRSGRTGHGWHLSDGDFGGNHPTGVGTADVTSSEVSLFTRALTTTCTRSTHSCTATIGGNSVTFTDLEANDATIGTDLNTTAYDTAILYQLCSFGSSGHSALRTAVNNFVQNGGKVIIFDADGCAPHDIGNSDYSAFVQPFKVNSVGANGDHEPLTYVEPGDSLVTGACTATSTCNGSDGDEVGDSNVFTSAASSWCIAAKAKNGNGVEGVLMGYASQAAHGGGGLSIYIGTDTWFTFGQTAFNTTLFNNAITQAWNGNELPCTTSVASTLPSPTPTATPTPTSSVAAVAVPATGTEDVRGSGTLLALILVAGGVATLIPAALLRNWVTHRRRNRH